MKRHTSKKHACSTIFLRTLPVELPQNEGLNQEGCVTGDRHQKREEISRMTVKENIVTGTSHKEKLSYVRLDQKALEEKLIQKR